MENSLKRIMLRRTIEKQCVWIRNITAFIGGTIIGLFGGEAISRNTAALSFLILTIVYAIVCYIQYRRWAKI